MATAYLSFGANLGDRLANFKAAEEYLKEMGVRFVEWSSIYETEPVVDFPEDQDQPWFYNAVAKVEANQSPLGLLLVCQEAERRVGRFQKTETTEMGGKRFLPRVIDIDILLYEDDVIQTDILKIPHERIHERLFALKPLYEIAPNILHAGLNQTISELLQACNDSSTVRVLPAS